MIELALHTDASEVGVRLEAQPENSAVLRQVLRGLGEANAIAGAALDDAELALSEAFSNVVKHAYPEGPGPAEVRLAVDSEAIALSVRDRGRGIGSGVTGDGRERFGLALMEGASDEFEIIDADPGVAVRMRIALDRNPSPRREALALIGRRAISIVAARSELPFDRLTDAALVGELLAKYAPEQLDGDRVELALRTHRRSFEVRIGPFDAGGATRVVEASRLPVVGVLLDRLPDEIEVLADGRAERLSVRFHERVEEHGEPG